MGSVGLEAASVGAACGGQVGGVDAVAGVVEGLEEGLRAAQLVVGGADGEVEVGSGGASGVAGGEDLGAGGDVVAGVDVQGASVAVGPVRVVIVGDRGAGAAGCAAVVVLEAVVGPGVGGEDLAAADGVDGGAFGDCPVPCGVVVVGVVEGRAGEEVEGAR